MKKALFLLPWLFATGAFSQAPLSDQWNKLALKSPFLAHPISLRMANEDTISLGNSTLSYFSQQDDFKEVTNPQKSSGFTIDSERYVAVNGWKFYGNFLFSRYTDEGTQFTVHTDPTRDTPYKIADAITDAHWKKQRYLLDARIVTPELARNLKAGLQLKYDVLNGARQVDPRPADRTINLTVAPQLMYQLGKVDLGVVGHYTRFTEDLSISIQNNQLSKNIYKQLGLGEYLYNGPILLSGGLSRLYEGNTYETGLSIGKKLQQHDYLQGSFQFHTHSETATDGTSTPFNAGLHERNELTALLTYERNRTHLKQVISFKGTQRKSENTEYIQILNNETLQYEVIHSSAMHWATRRTMALTYQAIKYKAEGLPNWQWGASADYQQRLEEYPSTLSDLAISAATLSGTLKKSFHWQPFSLTIGYQASWKAIMDEDLTFYPNPKTDNFIASKVLYPNYYYQTTGAWRNKAEVQITLPAFDQKQAQLYFKAIAEQTKSLNTPSTLASQSLSNHYLTFTIGLYN